MRLSKLLMVILILALIGGCTLPMPKPSGDPYNPIRRLAVLPLVNNTNDVDAPEMVRERLVLALEANLYNVQPLEETNQILRDQMGITLGGQLEMAERKVLAEKLGVEGLLYGDLMDFKETTTGVYNSRNVRGRFKIVNAMDEGVFWQNGIGVKSQDSHGGVAGDAAVLAAGVTSDDDDVPWVIIDSVSTNESILTGMAIGLGTKLVSKATGMHLRRETDEMIRMVFETLPMGPGETTVAAMPAAEMPEMPMPAMPVFGYVDFGERDFSAVMVSTTVSKTDNRRVTFEMPVAKAGKKFRTEIDYSSMTQGESMPPTFSQMVTIHRGDEKLGYMLFPNVKKYMVNEDVEQPYEVDYEVKREEVGKEVIDGHPTIKYKVQVTFEGDDVSPQEGFVWRATDLGDMMIKSEMENETVRFSTILKNIVLKTPADALFEVPAGFIESKNFMEIVMEGQ
ncbi:MAG: GNA1162 family protein [Thermodesulfobacteriota bacterium]